MLFLGRSPCEDFKCNYKQRIRFCSQKQRPVGSTCSKVILCSQFYSQPGFVYSSHAFDFAAFCFLKKNSVSVVWQISPCLPVFLFLLCFAQVPAFRDHETRRYLISLCLLKMKCGRNLLQLKIWSCSQDIFFLCATVIICANVPFSQIQYRRALTFGDMTTIACPKMIICDSCLQDSGFFNTIQVILSNTM